MTDLRLTELAREAYLYYYPLVEDLRQVQRYVHTGIGSNPAAPFNTFSHARRLAGPETTFVTINNDTVYSVAQLDLSAGPLKLEIPDTAGRYYVMQFIDAWTNNIAYVGTRATGNQAGRFVITPPEWTGTVPDGYTEVAASTAVVSVNGRFACAGPDDLAAVTALQDVVVLEPLDGKPSSATVGVAGADDPDEALLFWEQARMWSQQFPAPPQDRFYADRYSPLGLTGPMTVGTLAEDVRDGLIAGYQQGAQRLEYLTGHSSMPVRNGWTVGMHAFDYNVFALGVGTIDSGDWTIDLLQNRIEQRAIACRIGLWGNHGYEAVYAQAFTSVEGATLDGNTTYQIAFTQPPPVDAFWSITLYDIPRYYLVGNPIDRYSIGDRTRGIRFAQDGSLTITIGNIQPKDADARANWLPAPAGPFRLVLRLYIPRPAVLDGSYQFAPITSVSPAQAR